MSHTVLTVPPAHSRLRLAVASGAAVVVAAVLGAWLWTPAPPAPGTGVLAVPAARGEAIVRRAEVAFADAQSVWDRAIVASRREYHRAEVSFFSRATASACAAEPLSGPFYCPADATAAFDVAYLDALGERLKRGRELGLALYAVRLSAAHMQRELGLLDSMAGRAEGSWRGRRYAAETALALQADCLAGVWAAAAEPRLGPVPGGFWSQLVWSARNVADDLSAGGGAGSFAFEVFAGGDPEARDAAFTAGYAGGRVSDCRLSPEA